MVVFIEREERARNELMNGWLEIELERKNMFLEGCRETGG
jgi:hypothetical protein